MIGQTINKLTVIEYIGRKNKHKYWKCKCDCGNHKEVREYSLLKGKPKSCGKCYLGPDLTGQAFGMLTVLSLDKKQGKSNEYHWICECECGLKSSVNMYSLTSGLTRSCGCLRGRVGDKNPNWKGFQELSGHHWRHIQIHAKDRNLSFKVSIKYAWELFEKQDRQCALSGLPIEFGRIRYKEQTASLDRIDSSKGYVRGNVQWIHKDVNWMKTKFPQDYFIKLCNLVSSNCS